MVFAFDVRCGLGGGGERFARPTLNGGSDLRDKVRNAPRADQTQFVEVYVYDFTTAGGVISLESVIRVKDGPNEIIGQLHRDQKRWIVRAVSLPHFVKHLIAG